MTTRSGDTRYGWRTNNEGAGGCLQLDSWPLLTTMGSSEVISIDAHGHLHSCFDVCTFLERAHSNLSGAVSRISEGYQPTCVLFVLSTSAENGDGFHRLQTAFEQGTQDCSANGRGWQMRDTLERASMCLTSGREAPLVMIAGRQIPSRERLEVLALGTRREFEPGQSAEALIRKIARAGALPVLPWGAGKWLGKRGRSIEGLIESPSLPPFLLGDNANRPTLWPKPSQFRRAEEQGIKNLPGSDPLPFPGEVRRVGSYGVTLKGTLDLKKPARHLEQLLTDPSTTFRQFGREETPSRFVCNQLSMQLRRLTRS